MTLALRNTPALRPPYKAGLPSCQASEPESERRREPAGTGILFCPAEQLMASVFMCGVEDLLFGGSRFVWTVTVAAVRRWYAAQLRACRQALRAWCGLRDVYQVKTPSR